MIYIARLCDIDGERRFVYIDIMRKTERDRERERERVRPSERDRKRECV